MTLRTTILAQLPATYAEIVAATGKPAPQVEACLSALQRDGKIMRLGARFYPVKSHPEPVLADFAPKNKGGLGRKPRGAPWRCARCGETDESKKSAHANYCQPCRAEQFRQAQRKRYENMRVLKDINAILVARVEELERQLGVA